MLVAVVGSAGGLRGRIRELGGFQLRRRGWKARARLGQCFLCGAVVRCGEARCLSGGEER